jgi:hypothetical protein
MTKFAPDWRARACAHFHEGDEPRMKLRHFEIINAVLQTGSTSGRDADVLTRSVSTFVAAHMRAPVRVPPSNALLGAADQELGVGRRDVNEFKAGTVAPGRKHLVDDPHRRGDAADLARIARRGNVQSDAEHACGWQHVVGQHANATG